METLTVSVQAAADFAFLILLWGFHYSHSSAGSSRCNQSQWLQNSHGDRHTGHICSKPSSFPCTKGFWRCSHHQHQRYSTVWSNLVAGTLFLPPVKYFTYGSTLNPANTSSWNAECQRPMSFKEKWPPPQMEESVFLLKMALIALEGLHITAFVPCSSLLSIHNHHAMCMSSHRRHCT